MLNLIIKCGQHINQMADLKEISSENYYQERVETLKNTNKYPHQFTPTIKLIEYITQYQSLKNDETNIDIECALAGRVTAVRISSKKLFFYKINNRDHELQVMVSLKYYNSAAEFDMPQLSKIIRKGDIIGITGWPTRTKTGELSILAKNIVLLSPCYHIIPYELKDKAIRYQQRYLDLLVNPENRQIFITRNRIIQYIRQFLNHNEFIEVETPMMHPIAGGATAKPFITYHNAMDRQLYMRIAPELYLKKAIVSGFDRVYEIGKQFRNESIDLTHNPEFTTCEFYWAYQDYYGLMTVTENLLTGMVQEIKGQLKIQYNGKEIDFTPPFKRISMIDELEKQLKISFPKVDYSSQEMSIFLQKLCEDHKVTVSQPQTNSRMLDKLVSAFIEPLCVNPTLICDHPLIMSPLAKIHRANPQLTERFELFIDGMEYCNAYTELNDPFDQRQRFQNQLLDKSKGDDEAQELDEDFCKSLEYGLPPTAGWGAGIDRLTMLLTDSPSIKEVILFPALKPESE